MSSIVQNQFKNRRKTLMYRVMRGAAKRGLEVPIWGDFFEIYIAARDMSEPGMRQYSPRRG